MGLVGPGFGLGGEDGVEADAAVDCNGELVVVEGKPFAIA